MKTIKFLLTLIGLISFSAMAQPPAIEYFAFLDNDADGHASVVKQITAEQVNTYISSGWYIANHRPAMDCNDKDDLVFHNTKVMVDADGDKYANAYALLCIGTSVPAGYIAVSERLGSDCDDNDPAVYRKILVWIDKDQDRRTTSADKKEVCIGAAEVSPDPLYTPHSQILSWNDCDDNDPAVWQTVCVSDDPCKPNWSVCIGNTPPPGTVECKDEAPCPKTSPAKALSFDVYPNPVTDRLNITPKDNWNNRVEIKLVDQFGRVARVVNSASANKGQAINMNTSDLKPGIYQLIIKNGELMETKSIAVKL